jgi:long-chain-fatty-acid--CoA ligase ACSBG
MSKEQNLNTPKKEQTFDEKYQLESSKSTLKNIAPMLQISTETVLNNFSKENHYKDILWTCQIKNELPIFLSEAGLGNLKPMTVMELFESVVNEYGAEKALFIERKDKTFSYTWNQYFKYVNYFARAIISIGIPPFKTVNILGHNSPEWFISYIGGIYACIPPVGIYPTNSSETCNFIAQNSECACLVIDSLTQFRKYEKDLINLKSLKAVVFYCELSESEVKSLLNPFVPIFMWKDFLKMGKRQIADLELNNRIKMQKPGNCCNLIYTSGTTGDSKGVMLSHDNMTWTVRSLYLTHGKILGENPKLVSFLPLSHIAGQIVDIFLSMISKGQVHFAKPDALFSGGLVEFIRQVSPTIFFAVPRIFEKFEEKIREAIDSSSLIKRKIIKWSMNLGKKSMDRKFKGENQPLFIGAANYLVFSRVRSALGFSNTGFIAFGAAPLKKSTIEFFRNLRIPLFNNYGMSESTGPQALNLAERNVDLFSAGVPLNGTELKIYRPGRDGVGEILFRGRNRFMGYFKNEGATLETIDSDGYIHSGDLGYINKEGNLVITGRLKELIVTAGGENIAPLPIEEALKDICQIISQVVVIGDHKKFLSALITLKGDFKGNLSDEVREKFRQINPEVKTILDAIEDIDIKKHIQSCVDEVNKKAISKAQLIRKWIILPQEFSIENGELTPNHKVKRKVITQKYAKYVERMYLQGDIKF